MKVGDTVWFLSDPHTLMHGILADELEKIQVVRINTKYGPRFARSANCFVTKEACLQSKDSMLEETELKSINSVDDLVRYMLRNLSGRNREVAQLKAKEFGIDLEV